jgi:hypothetical protein
VNRNPQERRSSSVTPSGIGNGLGRGTSSAATATPLNPPRVRVRRSVRRHRRKPTSWKFKRHPLAQPRRTRYVSELPLAEVIRAPGFAVVAADRDVAPLPPSGLLDGVPEAVAEQARWWERHIVEILTGRPPEHEPTAPVNRSTTRAGCRCGSGNWPRSPNWRRQGTRSASPR